jgi:hypothetical protein
MANYPLMQANVDHYLLILAKSFLILVELTWCDTASALCCCGGVLLLVC